MTIYICSDVHYDFYVPPALPKNYFKRRFLPADVLVTAGDVANTFDDYARFIEDVSAQYKDTVLCLGNHDITVKFDKGRFKTSEEKISAIKELCSKYSNIHLLDGNCVEVGGVKFGGTMGMWDYSFLNGEATDVYSDIVEADWNWHCSWFDGQTWNYFGNDLAKIRDAEKEKLEAVLSQNPDVVLTHFCPLVSKMPSVFRHDPFSTYFYFDRKIADEYTKDGKIWCAGHVHTASREGNVFVNPLGYPGEIALRFNGLSREDFLVEMDNFMRK